MRKSSAFPAGAKKVSGGYAADKNGGIAANEFTDADGEAELRRTSNGIAEEKETRPVGSMSRMATAFLGIYKDRAGPYYRAGC